MVTGCTWVNDVSVIDTIRSYENCKKFGGASDVQCTAQGKDFELILMVKIRGVPNIRFEFKPDRIVGQMDYSYSAEYCHDLEPEYG